MPGNKNSYNDAIKKASNAAWDRRWDLAIREYQRALSEFPDDVAAHSGLALAFQESNRLEEALHEYRVSSKLQPHDPVSLAHTAGVLEKMGRAQEAASTYLNLADMFSTLRQKSKAVEAWHHAVALEPDRIEIREKLIAAYREAGHESAAIKELVALGKIYQRQGDTVHAQAVVERALALEPEHMQAKALMAELRGSSRSAPNEAVDSPVEMARRTALSRLAETVFDEGLRWRRPQMPGAAKALEVDVDRLLATAINAQTQGRFDEAMQAYQRIIDAGITRPEVQFNLGLLYKEALRYDDAIALLKQTATDPNFELASYLALGQSYRAQGKLDTAVEHFIQAMKIVDLSSVQREQADDVIRLYESLAESYRAQGAEAHAETFTQTLMDFLNSKGWEDKVREVRRHIEAVAESGTPVSFAEVLEVPHAERVIESLTISERFMKQGYLRAAGDEAYSAIALAPDYLPAHVRLAEIFVKAGRTQDAREKYERLAETAMVRGDLPKAGSFYRRALQLAPGDVTQRAKLIDLLVRQGHLPEALKEYLELGGALQQSGQTEKAIERYAEGLRLAKRAGAVGDVIAQLRSRLAEAYWKAQDWKNALPLYEQIRRESPDDERARYYLADLYRRVGQRERGDKDLNELLNSYASTPNKSRAILAAFVRNWPEDIPLHLMLTEQYVGAGEGQKAIELLDGLGERLLSAGQRGAAIQVIEKIIALNPPQVDDYRKLLVELKG